MIGAWIAVAALCGFVNGWASGRLFVQGWSHRWAMVGMVSSFVLLLAVQRIVRP